MRYSSVCLVVSLDFAGPRGECCLDLYIFLLLFLLRLIHSYRLIHVRAVYWDDALSAFEG